MNKMIGRISFETATRMAILLFGLFALFHLVVILGILIFEWDLTTFLWGGKMETKESLVAFEWISLGLQLVFLWIVYLRRKLQKRGKYPIGLRIALWAMAILFALNTVGNLLAESSFEHFLSIVTILLSLLCFRIALPEHRTD